MSPRHAELVILVAATPSWMWKRCVFFEKDILEEGLGNYSSGSKWFFCVLFCNLDGVEEAFCLWKLNSLSTIYNC